MATILGNWYARIKNGWKTVGVNGLAAFASSDDWIPTDVGPISAMKLSAYFSCIRLLSETMGSMSFKLYDENNNLITDHYLLDLMDMPNSGQTGDGLVSAMTANKTMFGNGMSHIKRLAGKPVMLDFYASDLWTVDLTNQGIPKFSLNGEEVPYADVLHWPGMSINGYWGIPTLAAASEVLAMQKESNRSAAQTFANGLRAGGFFELPENRQAFNDEQMKKFNDVLQGFSQPQNTAKWLTLLPGMKPIPNASWRIDPVTAELLQSRYFGIEEICRFMGVPPPLIGHTDKASSWASSIENLNEGFVTYTLLPQAIRFENEIKRKLLGRNDRYRLNPKFNMDSLLRGTIDKRFTTYKTAIEEGIMNPNEVRAKENMPPRAGGDKYASSAPKQTPAAPAAKEQ